MESRKKNEQPLVVGLGASAGGLEALKVFFQSLPEETGMIYIVVLHLAPDQESRLAELLQHETSLKIQKVSESTQIKPEHVYVIPPNKMLSVEGNHLELSEPENEHARHTIDLLFRTLAQNKEAHAAGLILSGTGADGAVGIKAIKEHGGVAIAQAPGEAQHPGMPQNAIKTGVVDKVLPVADIAEELTRYKDTLPQIHITNEDESKQQLLFKIFDQIRSKTGHDFGNYRRSSVLRRIERRMRVTRLTSLSDYLDFLEKSSDEIKELFKDLLISVTNFFRDPEAFETLEKKVIPKLFEDKDRDDQVRVWVPGCATGEEAYSIAILLQEHATEQDIYPEIQVFASDIDEDALRIARKGIYPASINVDVTEERLHRFFNKEGDSYRIKEDIREMVLFASHDLLQTPPFSKQDMIACRNLLIYLTPDLQEEVFKLFHYALRPNGWLFLGTSDSIIGGANLFTSFDKKLRIYRPQPTTRSRSVLPDMPLPFNKSYLSSNKGDYRAGDQEKNIEKLHLSLLARLYAPQSVLITKDYEVIHSTDGIQKYLEYGGGEPSSNVLDMIRADLHKPLRNLLFQLQDGESSTLQKRIQVNLKDQPGNLELVARQYTDAEIQDGIIHVIFNEIAEEEKQEKDLLKGGVSEDLISESESKYIESLERELEYTKEQLQLSVEEYETSIEKLRASNEELQSMNEELQMTTEELETSQEELRSVNEELEDKVEELTHAHSDLENLMEATEVGIIFVDTDYRVQRYTSKSTDIFNFIGSDQGRPLNHITHSLDQVDLMDDVKHVLETLDKVKKVVTTDDNRWFIMRLRPYRSTENKIKGVVITFTEFTELQEARVTIRQQGFQESLATLGVYALEQNDLHAILKRAIDLGCINLELDCAVIYVINEDQNTFKVAEQAGCAQKEDPITIEEASDIGFALRRAEEPTIVTNYDEEDRFTISPNLKDEDIVSSIYINVRGSEETYGLLGFYSYEKRKFTDEEVHFLQVVANIVGMSIQQHYSRQALEKETERSRQYQRDILNNSIKERWEIGGYLHDNLGQILASAKILANDIKYKLSESGPDVLEEIDRINSIIDDGIRGIRDLTHDIIPLDIEEEGVDHAFRFLMRQTQKMHKINCILKTNGILNEIKNRKVATHLYYVVQEAIKNAALHGKAENVRVKVSKSDEDETLVLKIEDDGIGISQTEKGTDSKGLRIMKYRMELLDGTFDVKEKNSGEKGTCIVCSVPLKNLTNETN